MCNDCYYNIRNEVCPIFETYKTNIYSKNEDKNPNKYWARYRISKWRKKFWIKKCLIPWSYNCHQEIQKYIRIICNNFLDIIMQNHGQIVFREVCDDCYYNIRSEVCPIFETYNTTFIQKIKIRIPRSIKQDTKSLNRGGNFWIKMCLRSQS